MEDEADLILEERLVEVVGVLDDAEVVRGRQLGEDVVHHLERPQGCSVAAGLRNVATDHQHLEANAAGAQPTQVVVVERRALPAEAAAPNVDRDVRVSLDDRMDSMELARPLEEVLRDHGCILRDDVKRP